MIFKFNQFIVSYALLGITINNKVNGEGLRGASTMEMVPSFGSYDEYIESMITDEEPKGNSTSLFSSNQFGSFPTLTTAEFPEGIFDKSKIDDPKYLNSLLGKCSDAINSNPDSTPGEKLGCHLLSNPSWGKQSMALGSLKSDVNLIDAMEDGSYKKVDITQFFKNAALAVMIDEGCFSFDSGGDISDVSSNQFVDESSYKTSVKNSDSFEIDTSAKAFGVTVSTGYKKLSSSETKETKDNKYAFGEKKWYANVGTLYNTCMTDEGMFKEVIVANSLIKDEWIEKWNAAQAPCSWSPESSFLCTACVRKVVEIVDGGLLIPTSYNYGARVHYTIRSTYEAKSSETTKDMSEAISAGLSVEFGEAGGSISSKVETAVTDTLSQKNMHEQVYVNTKGYGNKVDISCVKDDSCSSQLLERVEEMRGDFNLVGKPLGHSSFISLDDIVFWYTGKRLSYNFWKVADIYQKVEYKHSC